MDVVKLSLTKDSRELKPFPKSTEEFMKECKSLQHLDKSCEPPPRAKLYHHALSSAQINRPFDTAMILLLGSSGVGKSSTINHLLDTGEGVPLAMTSNSKSETRKTSEYVVTVDEPIFEVCDLKISIIDTPGFNDGSGVKQDACNFVSIKNFFETHPRLPTTTVYPNLVFLVVSAMDQRVERPNSNLSKCLRGIKLLEVVDIDRPNLVVIVTFCCSLPHKNVMKWEKRMQGKKELISRVVYEVLGVRAPAVLLENDYEDQELTKAEDFTLLPNNEKQPKNLYNACLELLEQNKDGCGQMIFNAAFTRAKKKGSTDGHECVAKDSCENPLSDEEDEFAKLFSEAAMGGVDPIPEKEYVTENKLNKEQKEEVFQQKSEGVKNVSGVDPIPEKEYVKGNKLNKEQPKEEACQQKSESVSDIPEYIGQGYNVFMDRPVPAEIMTFSSVDERLGLRLPACSKIVKRNETRKYQMEFQNDTSYVESRLLNLDLDVDFAQTILKMAPIHASWKKDRSSKSKKTTKTSLIEYRKFKLNLDIEAKEISRTNEFESAVKKLPDQYTEERDKQTFETFFRRFGHYVVTSVYLGGAVEITTCAESEERSAHREESSGGSVGAKIPDIGVRVELSGKTQPSTKTATTTDLNMKATRWCGGRIDLHNKSTRVSEEKLHEWDESLSEKPAILTNEMSLEPIFKVVSLVDETKGKSCSQALLSLFSGNLRSVRNQQDNEQELCRRRSNNRLGTTKEPNTDEWWESINASTFIISGAIVAGILALLCTIGFRR